MGRWRKTGLSLISNNDHKVSAVENKNNWWETHRSDFD